MGTGMRKRIEVRNIYQPVSQSPIPVGGIPPEGIWKVGVNFFAKKKVLEIFFPATDIEEDFEVCEERPGILKFTGENIDKYNYLLGKTH